MNLVPLDAENPWHIISRTQDVGEPLADYKHVGDAAAIVFPAAGDLRADGTPDVSILRRC